MGCCGGSAPVVQAANEALNDMLNFATGGAAGVPVTQGGAVRMEFIGDQLGARTFYGKGSGVQYRAGREPGSRFHDVDVRDVEYFLALGLFAIVQPEPLLASAVVEAVPVIPGEPRELVARPKGRKVQ